MSANLLPSNSEPLERALADLIPRISELEIPFKEFTDPNTAPEEFLPILAWSARVDVWNTNWPVETKRAVIRAAIPAHRVKGTRAAVEMALAALNAEVEIKEWFETGGAPRTFDALVSVDSPLNEEVVLSATRIADIAATIDANKPLSAHYSLTVSAKAKLDLGTAMTGQVTEVISVGAVLARAPIHMEMKLGASAHMRVVETINVEARL